MTIKWTTATNWNGRSEICFLTWKLVASTAGSLATNTIANNQFNEINSCSAFNCILYVVLAGQRWKDNYDIFFVRISRVRTEYVALVLFQMFTRNGLVTTKRITKYCRRQRFNGNAEQRYFLNNTRIPSKSRKRRVITSRERRSLSILKVHIYHAPVRRVISDRCCARAERSFNSGQMLQKLSPLNSAFDKSHYSLPYRGSIHFSIAHRPFPRSTPHPTVLAHFFLRSVFCPFPALSFRHRVHQFRRKFSLLEWQRGDTVARGRTELKSDQSFKNWRFNIWDGVTR